MDTYCSGSRPSSAGTLQNFEIRLNHPLAQSTEDTTISSLNCPRLIRQDPCKHVALRFTFPTGIVGAASAPHAPSSESRLTEMPMDATIRHLQLALSKQAQSQGFTGPPGHVNLVRTDTHWTIGDGCGDDGTCGMSGTGLNPSLYWTQGDDVTRWRRQLVPMRVDGTAGGLYEPDWTVPGAFAVFSAELQGIRDWLASEGAIEELVTAQKWDDGREILPG